jgi:hypothetical protein
MAAASPRRLRSVANKFAPSPTSRFPSGNPPARIGSPVGQAPRRCAESPVHSRRPAENALPAASAFGKLITIAKSPPSIGGMVAAKAKDTCPGHLASGARREARGGVLVVLWVHLEFTINNRGPATSDHC